MTQPDPTANLSPEERAQVQRLFSDPLSFPQGFKAWLTSWMEANPPVIPLGQVFGASTLQPNYASIGTEAHTATSSYGDPTVSGGAGPTLSNLSPGQYLVHFGASTAGTFASGVVGFMGLSINGSTPADDASSIEAQQTGNLSASRVLNVTLSNSTNTIKCVYRTSDGSDRAVWRYRWILALRYSN